jgi:hypothetical protein
VDRYEEALSVSANASVSVSYFCVETEEGRARFVAMLDAKREQLRLANEHGFSEQRARFNGDMINMLKKNTHAVAPPLAARVFLTCECCRTASAGRAQAAAPDASPPPRPRPLPAAAGPLSTFANPYKSTGLGAARSEGAAAALMASAFQDDTLGGALDTDGTPLTLSKITDGLRWFYDSSRRLGVPAALARSAEIAEGGAEALAVFEGRHFNLTDITLAAMSSSDMAEGVRDAIIADNRRYTNPAHRTKIHLAQASLAARPQCTCCPANGQSRTKRGIPVKFYTHPILGYQAICEACRCARRRALT